jgi:hypothetical protein
MCCSDDDEWHEALASEYHVKLVHELGVRSGKKESGEQELSSEILK